MPDWPDPDRPGSGRSAPLPPGPTAVAVHTHTDQYVRPAHTDRMDRKHVRFVARAVRGHWPARTGSHRSGEQVPNHRVSEQPTTQGQHRTTSGVRRLDQQAGLPRPIGTGAASRTQHLQRQTVSEP